MVALGQKPTFDGRSVYVPSRTKAGDFYRVDLAVDGTPICTCPAALNSRDCWHARYVKEELMTQELVPIKLAPTVSLLPTEHEMSMVNKAAALAFSGAVALPRELNTPQKVAAVMLYGLELGLRPMSALRHLYIVNGRVQPSAEVMAGLLMSAEPAARLIVESLDEQQCTMRIIRPSRAINQTYKVTWAEIEKAGLATTDANRKYPLDRLRNHCTKRILRIYAPDVINVLDGPALEPAGLRLVEEPQDDTSELYNEGDAQPTEGEFRDVAPVQAPTRPAPPAPPPMPQDDFTLAYMDLVKEHGTPAGQNVVAWALEMWPHAKGAKGRLDRAKLAKDEEEAIVAEIRRYLRSGIQRCADTAHRFAFNEDTTLMACDVCTLVVADPAEPWPADVGTEEEETEPVEQLALT